MDIRVLLGLTWEKVNLSASLCLHPNPMGLPKPIVQQLLSENKEHSCPEAPEICVKVMAIANLPDMFGEFQVVAFWNNFDRKEHAALIHGDIFEKEDVPVRLHSECLTGDTLGSLRCDCREQLQESMQQISKMERGVVLYMRQEGRGIGFINKIKAYQLQDEGYDTFRANEILGFKRDERDYDLAAHMLNSLHVKSVRLMTNNPAKIKDLQMHGIRITGRIPVIVPPNKYDKFYLETKKRAGHLLDKKEPEEFLEQSEDLVDNHHWEQAE